MIGLAGYIVVKLHLEAVALAAHAGNAGKGGIPLGPDGRVADGFPVDDQGAGDVGLTGGLGQHLLPFRHIHLDIQSMHPGIVKQAGFVSQLHLCGLDAQRVRIAKQDGEHQG